MQFFAFLMIPVAVRAASQLAIVCSQLFFFFSLPLVIHGSLHVQHGKWARISILRKICGHFMLDFFTLQDQLLFLLSEIHILYKNNSYIYKVLLETISSCSLHKKPVHAKVKIHVFNSSAVNLCIWLLIHKENLAYQKPVVAFKAAAWIYIENRNWHEE